MMVITGAAYTYVFSVNLPGWYSPIWDFATLEPHLTGFPHLISHIVFWDICINANNHTNRYLHRLFVLALGLPAVTDQRAYL